PRWDRADFVLVRGGDSHGELIRARRGTLLDPAQGATAIYEIDAVGTGCANSGSARLTPRRDPEQASVTLSLTGPGVGAKPRRLRLGGVSAQEIVLWQVTRSGSPCGVDLILLDRAGHCAALPRSTALERVA